MIYGIDIAGISYKDGAKILHALDERITPLDPGIAEGFRAFSRENPSLPFGDWAEGGLDASDEDEACAYGGPAGLIARCMALLHGVTLACPDGYRTGIRIGLPWEYGTAELAIKHEGEFASMLADTLSIFTDDKFDLQYMDEDDD